MDWRLDRLRFGLDPLIAEAKRRARRRRFQLLAAGMVVAGGAVAGVVVLHTPSAKPWSYRGVAAALRAGGVMVEGAGGICASPSGVFFTPSLPGVPDSPPPTVCDGAFRVRGLDLSRIKLFPVGHGVSLGSVEIKAVYLNGALIAAGQGKPPSTAFMPQGPRLSDLPCHPPAGGWSNVPASTQAVYDSTLSYRPQSDLTARYVFRSHGATVAAVASMRPARTRRVLGPQLAGRLCVVRSRYSNRVLQTTQERVAAMPGGIEEASPVGFGPGKTQPVIEVWTGGLVRPELRAFLRTTPPGLIKVFPGLRKVRS